MPPGQEHHRVAQLGAGVSLARDAGAAQEEDIPPPPGRGTGSNLTVSDGWETPARQQPPAWPGCVWCPFPGKRASSS